MTTLRKAVIENDQIWVFFFLAMWNRKLKSEKEKEKKRISY